MKANLKKFPTYHDLEQQASKVETRKAIIEAEKYARVERAEKDPGLLQLLLDGAVKEFIRF